VTEPWTSVVTGEMVVAFPVEEYKKGAAANAARILSGVRGRYPQLGCMARIAWGRRHKTRWAQARRSRLIIRSRVRIA
jgi:hypothetical protein